MVNYLYALRPQQWIKNLFIFLPLVFSKNLSNLNLDYINLLAFLYFCAIASSVYIFNDFVDLKADRVHPEKKLRPLPSGKVRPSSLFALGFILLLLGSIGSFYLNIKFGFVVSGYFISNLAYAFFLKEMVILDVMCIAFFFVLRVVAGAVAIDVEISHWLIICTALLALFLGFNKRRHEIKILEKKSYAHRKVLERYSEYFIDQMISVLTASTVVFYTIYTIDSRTVTYLGTQSLLFTVPFVYYGIFRYLYLVHKRGKGGDPTRVVLSDNKMIINLLLWFIVAAGIIHFKL